MRTNLNSSQRNRPGNEGKEIAAPENDALQQGMDPMELGAKVLEAVQAGEFFICPHPEFRDVIKARDAALEAAFKGEAPPEVVEVMKAMIVPF